MLVTNDFSEVEYLVEQQYKDVGAIIDQQEENQ